MRIEGNRAIACIWEWAARCQAGLRSFRVRLWTLILLIIIPGVGISIYANFEERGVEKNRVRERALASSELAASNEEDFMDHAQQILATLTQFPWLVLNTNEMFVHGNLANLCKLLPSYATFGLIETNGEVFCSATKTNSGVNLGDRSYFQRVVRTEKFAVGDLQTGRLTGRRGIDFGYPVFDEAGVLRRVLFASLPDTNFYGAVKDIRIPSGGRLTVLDPSGNVVVRCPGGEAAVGRAAGEAPAVKEVLKGKIGTFEMKGGDGIGRLYAVTPACESGEPRMFVMVEVPLAEVFAPANQALARNMGVLGGLAVLLYLGAAWYARHFFVSPVQRLVRAADRLASGDLAARVGGLRGPAELQRLAGALDDMAVAVEGRTAELVRANESLRKEMVDRERAEQEVKRQAEEKKKLEEQFLRSQRMQSLGALAGGIAHDLNNALVPVLMGTEMLRETANGRAEERELLEMISASGQRCTAMVKQILTFAKGTHGEGGAVPLRHLILETVKIARETFPRNIKLQSSVPSELWPVAGEPTELHQILMNLCVNARDAMPDGGTLSLRAQNVSLPGEQAPGDGQPGEYVLLTVSDTGTGIRPEIRERIFEPFFTTKGAEKGTGLGLSTVSSLVKRHGGFIRVESEVGKGSEFKIYLRGISHTTAAAEPADSTLPPGNGEMILLVDDEQTILQLATSLLHACGYRVVAATNGVEAINCFEEKRNEISLMIIDRDMPFMDGLAAARRVRATAPALPIIIASATKPETSSLVRADVGKFGFVQKPYTRSQLLKSIAKELGRANAAEAFAK